MIPQSRPLYNGTSFVVSIGSYLPYMSLSSSLHNSLFDCIWPLLLKTILKYSPIQAYVTFQSHHVDFIDVLFSHCQLIGLILAKLLMLISSVTLVTILKVTSSRH